jgi:hypothetical protein
MSGPPPLPTGGRPHSTLRRRLGIAVAVGVPVVTAATILIPLIADSGSRPTSLDTVEVGTDSDVPIVPAGHVSATLSDFVNVYRSWFVPLDAPFSSVPTGPAAEGLRCSQEQWEWLEQWELKPEGLGVINDGTPTIVDMANTATDGASLSITNLRAQHDDNIATIPAVRVVCAPPLGGFEYLQMVEVDFAGEEPAAWGAFTEGLDEAPQTPGTIFTLNLAPGEATQLGLIPHWPAGQFRGSVVADVTAGGATETVVILDGIFRPEATIPVTFMFAGEYLMCDDDKGLRDCTASDMAEIVAQ